MPVSDEDITKRLQELLETVDMETTSERKLREMLETEFSEDLKERKAIIRQEINNYLERQERENEDDGEDGAIEDDEGADNGDEPAAKRESKLKKGRKNHHFGSILSPELQEFLGVESMPRTQVVKAIWVYIKEHNLQDPKDKRKIRSDEKLGKILPPRTTMLKMNQHLSKHVYTQDHYDDEEDAEDEPQPKRKAAPKATAAKKPATKKTSTSTKAKRKPAAAEDDGHQDDDEVDEEEEEEDVDEKPKKRKRKAPSAGKGSLLSPELQAFVGAERMGRFQVVKVIWAYIREKGLQDPSDRRQILPDAKLGKILHAPVTAFTMNKQLSKHILKSS